MSTIRANSITNAAGTGAPNFPNGITAASIPAASLTGNLPAISGAALTNLTAANLTGNLPAINGSALTNLPAPTTAQVGTATAGLAAGAVGTYAFCVNASGATLGENATVAGSSLRLSDSRDAQGSALAGTWLNMGKSIVTGGPATLFLRIS